MQDKPTAHRTVIETDDLTDFAIELLCLQPDQSGIGPSVDVLERTLDQVSCRLGIFFLNECAVPRRRSDIT